MVLPLSMMPDSCVIRLAADKIYDLQESTFWQTVDNTAYPHQVVIDLGKEYNVTGFRILPRAEQGAPGMIKDYKVYVKATGFGY